MDPAYCLWLNCPHQDETTRTDVTAYWQRGIVLARLLRERQPVTLETAPARFEEKGWRVR